MKLKIHDIKIGERIRSDVSDIKPLMESIQTVGLLNPVIVNEENELLSGFRRLEACKQLGWTEIDIIIANTYLDKVKELDIEYHENVGRADLSQEEFAKYQQVRTELLTPAKVENKFWLWLKKLWNMIINLFTKKDKERK